MQKSPPDASVWYTVNCLVSSLTDSIFSDSIMVISLTLIFFFLSAVRINSNKELKSTDRDFESWPK